MPYCLIKAGIAITIWRFQAHTDNIMRKVWNRQILSYVYNVINHKHRLSLAFVLVELWVDLIT